MLLHSRSFVVLSFSFSEEHTLHLNELSLNQVYAYVYLSVRFTTSNYIISVIGELDALMLNLIFGKNMLNTSTFANIFNFIWIFSYSHLSNLKVTKQ